MKPQIKGVIFYVGLVLIFLGTLGLTFWAFFAIVGLPLFIIGLILILTSSRTPSQKIRPITFFGLSIAVFWIVWKMINSVGLEVFLIPNEYRGKVNIIFKEGCGITPEKSSDGIIYQVPEDGILILDQKQKFGLIDHRYFFVDEEGNRTEIPKMDVRDFNEEWTLEKNPNEPPREKLGVFHWGRTGSIGKRMDAYGNVTNEDELYTYGEFYISTYHDLTEKFNFKYDHAFDSLKRKKLEICK